MNSYEQKQYLNVMTAIMSWNNENQPMPKIKGVVEGTVKVNDELYIAIDLDGKLEVYVK